MKSIVRSSGILLHPTSLPGPFGIGDFGPEAYRWVQALKAARQSWWQILPLSPSGAGDSPYQAFSAFAGNIAMISPELLVQDGLISPKQLEGVHFRPDCVEYQYVLPYKKHLIREALNNFTTGSGVSQLRSEYEEFQRQEGAWLEDYCQFMAIHELLGGKGLGDWPDDLRQRQPSAIATICKTLRSEISFHRFGQFLIERQWHALKTYANQQGVKIIGDAPIFISADSSDVWANSTEYLIDPQGRLTVVAGVPPDYFSPTGQRWGNPIYDWSRMEQTGFAWWVARVRRLLTQTDLVRLDHFRGFAQAWQIPVTDDTALNGRWVDGPGYKLFAALRDQLGTLPLIAEDLGLITEDVHELRKQVGLPGMAVLQFALGGPDSPHWPHNLEPNTVIYTGTHDNDTTVGWYKTLDQSQRATIDMYLGRKVQNPAWELLHLAWSSVACLAIAPLQDVLALDSDARMNVPGKPEGNWRWRLRPEQYRPDRLEHLAELTTFFNRVPPLE